MTAKDQTSGPSQR